MSNNYYKSIEQYAQEWRTLFDNARKYNQEGSWVYVDAEEMNKVFDEACDRLTTGSGIPGAKSVRSDGITAATSPMDEDHMIDTPSRAPRSTSRANTRQVVSDDDDDYLSGSDDE